MTSQTINSLYDRIISDPNIAAVGSKIIYMNNKLQEAGSMIWNDGSAYGYGRGDNPRKPEYSFCRQVDFCSGASLLVKNKLFKEVGGFKINYAPAYYEEVDLCLDFITKGYKVLYEPKSIIYHREYGSSTPAQAMKLMQQNQKKNCCKVENISKNKTNAEFRF